jgi:hypothetical protein
MLFGVMLLVAVNSARGDEKLKGIACRSVHLGYPAPTSVAFYNEVTVEQTAPGTYFMVCGWSKGYFGIQELGNGKKLALFSVWDPGSQDDPKLVKDEDRVKLLHQGEGVRVGRFGNEGTGGQSFFDLDWKVGETYRFLVTARAVDKRSEYAGYLFLPEKKEWKHLVTFSTPTGGTLLKGCYSFVEDFKRDKVSTTKTRRAQFGNAWIQTEEGQWQAVTRAKFTADANPVTNIDAGIAKDRFFLSTGGEIENTTVKLWQSMDLDVKADRKVPDDLPKGLAALDKEAKGWKAGVARAVITPEKSVWLAGYGSKRAPDGKLHDLWMKALALEDQTGKRVVLITSDFQGVPKVMSDPVFAKVREKYGLERQHIMFTFSHNHCGPRLGDDLVDYYPIEEEQVRLVDEYTEQMVTKTVELVGEALSKLSPARLQTGQGQCTFAVNRRNNKEAEIPDLLAKGTPLVGPVDHTVPVLTVTRPDGRLEAILFGYACHPTTLSFTKWCGDYPGFAQLELEQSHPGVTAMFVNTCGGDQNPLPRRKVELCEKYGHMLAVSVDEALKQPLKAVSPGIRTAFELIDLPYLKVTTREELTPLAQDTNAVRARWATRMLKKLDDGDTFETAYPYPLHAWRLGNEMLVVGMGAETVVDYALRFKQEFGPGTWVCGYADDMIAYIPSRRVWDEGGYEGGSNLFEYGRPALRWAGDIEERIAGHVRTLVEQVRKE